VRLGPLYYALWQQGKRAIPGGTCPTVGAGGHILGAEMPYSLPGCQEECLSGTPSRFIHCQLHGLLCAGRLAGHGGHAGRWGHQQQSTRYPAHLGLGAPEDTGALGAGGGYGKWSRLHGFVCDNLVGVEMVDTSGAVITANKTYNSDLLWGSCGGGGNNFGIVTTFVLQVPPSRVTARPACGEHSCPGCMGSRRQVIVLAGANAG